jgi:23S rRNA (adenine-N6)-dimethyltransferase
VAVKRRPARGAPGQHFLRSRRLAQALVAEAAVVRDDWVVEIGAGEGIVTDALQRTGACVVAVERDARLATRLRTRFGAARNVDVVEADAEDYVWPQTPFAIVANLPFARSGAILARLLREPRTPLRQALVIVQWQFAAKQAAVWPATLRSTYWRAWFDVSLEWRLDRAAFAPPPSVDAAVLRIVRREHERVDSRASQAYWRFLSGAFAMGSVRHGVRAELSARELKRLAPALGFTLDAHARDLDARQWAALFTFATRR